jgi:YfiH family protein
MQRKISGSLVYYQFENLLAFPELSHGVFTRLGGHSRPPWHSLNTGHTVGDDPQAVGANHRLICRALGFSTDDIISPYQVHGAAVAVVGARDRGRIIYDTDALVTQAPGVLLMLRFADCTPIWLYDPTQGAIGLAHAGWRGTVAGTARAAAEAMQSAFGSKPADLVVGIGPAIGPCCYEVGEDVALAVRNAFPDLFPQLLVPRTNGKWHLDLWAANWHILARSGVRQIEVAGVCTACHSEEWFSHRAEHGQTGRIGALIGLRR